MAERWKAGGSVDRCSFPPFHHSTIPPLSSPFYGPANELTAYVDAYSKTGDVGALFDQLKALAKRHSPEVLIEAAQPFKDIPEVIIPLYERVVAERPNDAQSMVVLANAYWLAGRGGGVTGAL